MSKYLWQRFEAKQYHNCLDYPLLAQKLSSDLRYISKDNHLSIRYKPKQAITLKRQEQRQASPSIPAAAQLQKWQDQNYGFKTVQQLDYAIGYLKFDAFFPPQYAAPTATAALNFLRNSRAFIIDLRDNKGGSPAMIQFLSSYFLGHIPVHLNTFYWRPSNSYQEFWSLPYVPGKTHPDSPLYLLTSSTTFSAAEEFCYNLKHLQRATLIGSTTKGGAHPNEVERINNKLLLYVPKGRAINPITQSNWEGIGVRPHIEQPAQQVFATAFAMAKAKTCELPIQSRADG